MSTDCDNSMDAYLEMQHLAANCNSVTEAGLSFACFATAFSPGVCGTGFGQPACICHFTYLVGINRSSEFISIIPPQNPMYSDGVILLLIAAAFIACVKFVIK